jgi:hypothetical protein
MSAFDRISWKETLEDAYKISNRQQEGASSPYNAKYSKGNLDGISEVTSKEAAYVDTRAFDAFRTHLWYNVSNKGNVGIQGSFDKLRGFKFDKGWSENDKAILYSYQLAVDNNRPMTIGTFDQGMDLQGRAVEEYRRQKMIRKHAIEDAIHKNGQGQ